MILLADSGSTKTQWNLITAKELINEASTGGINPYTHTHEQIKQTMEDALDQLQSPGGIERIFFYGAGCGAAKEQQQIVDFLKVFKSHNIEVQSDLLGAARSLCGTHAGIVAILGTGSNACLYDGQKIISNRPSLGYVLGDEGAGTSIGKQLLKDYLYGNMPHEINTVFKEAKVEKEQVLHAVYKLPGANAYVASFVKLLIGQEYHPYVTQIIAKCFDEFINAHLATYTTDPSMHVHFTGSVAFHFQDILVNLIHKRGISMGRILKAPMDGLIDYHCSLLS